MAQCCCDYCLTNVGSDASEPQLLRSWNGEVAENYVQTLLAPDAVSLAAVSSTPVAQGEEENWDGSGMDNPQNEKSEEADTDAQVVTIAAPVARVRRNASGIQFSNATPNSGIDVQGESWGAAWGDVNQDGLPDVYLSRHLGSGLLFVNQGDGTFEDETIEYFGQETRGDKHGAAFADFDNDGDQDLIQLRGGRQTTQLFQNDGQGSFTDIAASVGLEYTASGRTPLWFDGNFDGNLDVVITARNRDDVPPTIFQQGANGFQNVGEDTGFTSEEGLNQFFSILTNIGGSPALDLLTNQAASMNGFEALEPGQAPFRQLSLPESLLTLSSVEDVISGDFDGDLQSDLFFTRARRRGDVHQPNDNALNAFLTAGDREVRFQSRGNLTLDFPTLNARNIFIGGQAINPTQNRFVISSNDAVTRGRANFEAGSDRGLYLSYDPRTQEWILNWSSPRASDSVYAFIEAQNAISEVETRGFNPEQQFAADQLFLRRNQTFENVSEAAGFIEGITAGVSAASGDFDNDADLDIYVVSTGVAGNRNNIVYENQGDGTFIARQNVGGIGTGRGLGDAVTTVDYDQDGFLDIFLSNGNLFEGFGSISREYFNDAPFQLLRNEGNDNSYLLLDLIGVNSNRDAVGSRVLVTADGKTQLREQNNGIHNRSQNHQRIHFGLAQATRASSVEINWTNGIRQIVRGVSANQLLTVTEGVGFIQRDIIYGTSADETFRGLGGDDRLISRGGNDRLLGGNGDDELHSGSGRDIIVGGAGNDLIFTGGGADRIRFTSINGGRDEIRDFSVASDRFEIVNSGFGNLFARTGTIAANQFVIGTTARTANHRFIFNRNNGDLFFDADGTGNQAQVLLARLTNNIRLEARNISVI